MVLDVVISQQVALLWNKKYVYFVMNFYDFKCRGWDDMPLNGNDIVILLKIFWNVIQIILCHKTIYQTLLFQSICCPSFIWEHLCVSIVYILELITSSKPDFPDGCVSFKMYWCPQMDVFLWNFVIQRTVSVYYLSSTWQLSWSELISWCLTKERLFLDVFGKFCISLQNYAKFKTVQ